MFVEPMMAKKIDVVPEGDTWVMEAKWDGWRAIAGRPADGKPAWLETRSGNRITAVPYVQAGVEALVPENSVIDGELISPDGNWNRVQHIASREGRYRHVPTEGDKGLMLVVFDALILDGDDLRGLPLRERRERLEGLFEKSHADFVSLQPQLECTEDELERLLNLGFEGAVVKNLDSRYVPGRRSTWGKLKPQETEDVILTGFYDAEPGSKYDGVAVGGCTWKAANGYEGRAAGMNDDLREEMYEHPERFINRLIEISHLGETTNRDTDVAARRSPNFVRFRDDKTEVDAVTPPAKKRGAKTTTRTTIAPKRKPPATASAHEGRNPRNYGAITKPGKLEQIIRELRAESGDGYDRAELKHTGVVNELRLALKAAADKGLVV